MPARNFWLPTGSAVVRNGFCRCFMGLCLSVLVVGLEMGAFPNQIQAQESGTLNFPEQHRVIQKAVDKHEVAGFVTAVVRPSGQVVIDTAGYADLETKRPMEPNTIFWIASMTKPFTGLAICKLEEEGLLKLDDPVSKYIPEFKDLKDAQGELVTVTIIQLMTHTSGLQDIGFKEQVDCQSLAEMIPLFVAKPVKFEPGTQWSYCQSSINTAGRIVEILSGKKFENYLHDEFFKPLEMQDTTFFLTEEQNSRMATTYHRNADGTFQVVRPADLILQGLPPTSTNRASAPNGGLFSTAPDVARFYHMLLNEGELNGVRIVKPETVQRFRAVHTPPEMTTAIAPGASWGVGVCVFRETQGVTSLFAPGSFGHDGAYGTQSWIDPHHKYALIMMVQRTNYLGEEVNVTRKEFQKAVLDSLSGEMVHE